MWTFDFTRLQRIKLVQDNMCIATVAIYENSQSPNVSVSAYHLRLCSVKNNDKSNDIYLWYLLFFIFYRNHVKKSVWSWLASIMFISLWCEENTFQLTYCLEHQLFCYLPLLLLRRYTGRLPSELISQMVWAAGQSHSAITVYQEMASLRTQRKTTVKSLI